MESGKELRCIICGKVVEHGAQNCPVCGHEIVDKSAWYYKLAPNIAGAVVGAVFFWAIAFAASWLVGGLVRGTALWAAVMGAGVAFVLHRQITGILEGALNGIGGRMRMGL